MIHWEIFLSNVVINRQSGEMAHDQSKVYKKFVVHLQHCSKKFPRVLSPSLYYTLAMDSTTLLTTLV